MALEGVLPYFQPHTTNYTGQALGEIANTMQQREQASAAADEQTRQLHNAAVLHQYMQLDPSQRQAVYGQLPEDVKSWTMNPAAIPAPVKSLLQQAQDDLEMKKTKFATAGYDDPNLLGPGGGASARYYEMTHAAPPAEVVKGNVANDTYNNPAGMNLNPQLQDRQQIEDKRKLDANQQREGSQFQQTYSGVTLPESKAKIATEGTTQGKNVAETGLYRAQTREAAEKTKGLAATNAILGGLGGVAPTGGGGGGVAGGVAGGPDLSKEPSQIVRMIVNRDYDPMLLRRIPIDQQEALFARAAQYDPSVGTSNYGAQAQAKKAFTSGPQAQNRTSISTAIRHVSALLSDANQLENNSIPAYNVAGNWLGTQFGNERIQKATASVNKDADAVATELSRAFRGSSQMTEKEIQGWRAGIGPNATPAQLRGAAEAAVKLLAGRASELDTSFKQGVGRPSEIPPVSKEAQGILKHFKLDSVFDEASGGLLSSGSGGSGSGGGGAPSPVPATPVAAPRLQKTQSNASGATRTVYSDDGGQTWHP